MSGALYNTVSRTGLGCFYSVTAKAFNKFKFTHTELLSIMPNYILEMNNKEVQVNKYIL